MSNGTTKTAFDIIKEYRDKDKPIPAALEKDLLFGALVELMDNVTYMKPWVDIFKWFLLLVGPALLLGAGAFVWLLVTHQFSFP